MNGKCAFDVCTAPADGYVSAQWTVADFVDYETCYEHRTEATVILENRLVDGLSPIHVWWTRYYPEGILHR